MSAPRVAGASPDIRVGGEALARDLASRVSSVLIRQAFDTPSLAEIELAAPAPSALAAFAPGTPLTVSAGGEVLFAGRVAGVEHEYEADGGFTVRVRAHDALHGLRMRRRFRVVEDASAASLWREAASDLGLRLETPESGPGRRIVQAGSSDLACLVRAGEEEGLHAVLAGDALRLVSLAGSGDTGGLAWGHDLLAVTIDEAGERAARSARAQGWSTSAAAAFTADARTARQDEEIEIRGFGLAELGQDQGELFATNAQAASRAVLEALARQRLDDAAAASLVATGTAVGDPALLPGARVRLTGLASLDAPTIVLTQATHRFEAFSGYTTAFSSAPPVRRTEASAPIVTLGEVLDVRDPEAGARCRVKLPAFGDVALGYFSVVIAGAGAGKGAAALPDVGDRVVVLFPSGDLADGLVLGGLYGGQRLPRGSTTTDPRAVVVASGGEQRLVLGGRQKTLSLTTARGDILSLGGAPSELLAAGDLTLAAVGGTLTIRANRIRFERTP